MVTAVGWVSRLGMLMARIGLTLYLMLAAAVGPWLCCCTAGRLFSLSPATKPTAHQRCCECPACHRGHPPGAPSDLSGDRVPAPRGLCPCNKDRPKALVSVESENSSAVERARSQEKHPSTELGAVLFSQACLALSPEGQGTGTPTVCSWRSPRDILRALHILLC
jgi:hypothetical protein